MIYKSGYLKIFFIEIITGTDNNSKKKSGMVKNWF